MFGNGPCTGIQLGLRIQSETKKKKWNWKSHRQLLAETCKLMAPPLYFSSRPTSPSAAAYPLASLAVRQPPMLCAVGTLSSLQPPPLPRIKSKRRETTRLTRRCPHGARRNGYREDTLDPIRNNSNNVTGRHRRRVIDADKMCRRAGFSPEVRCSLSVLTMIR